MRPQKRVRKKVEGDTVPIHQGMGAELGAVRRFGKGAEPAKRVVGSKLSPRGKREILFRNFVREKNLSPQVESGLRHWMDKHPALHPQEAFAQMRVEQGLSIKPAGKERETGGMLARPTYDAEIFLQKGKRAKEKRTDIGPEPAPVRELDLRGKKIRMEESVGIDLSKLSPKERKRILKKLETQD